MQTKLKDKNGDIDGKIKKTSCLNMIPTAIFSIVLLIILVLCIYDHNLVIYHFHKYTLWAKFHPYLSISYSIALLCFSIIFTLPISYTVVILGYTYSQIFRSKLTGFLFSVPIVFTGCLLGALLAFLLSRYLFKNFIRE